MIKGLVSLYLLSLQQYITSLKKKMWLSKLIYTLLTLLYFWQQWDYTGPAGSSHGRLLPRVWCDQGKHRNTQNIFSVNLGIYSSKTYLKSWGRVVVVLYFIFYPWFGLSVSASIIMSETYFSTDFLLTNGKLSGCSPSSEHTIFSPDWNFSKYSCAFTRISFITFYLLNW